MSVAVLGTRHAIAQHETNGAGPRRDVLLGLRDALAQPTLSVGRTTCRALLVPITTTLKPFLAVGEDTVAEVEAMHQAWVKAVLLQLILWSYPYVRAGDF